MNLEQEIGFRRSHLHSLSHRVINCTIKHPISAAAPINARSLLFAIKPLSLPAGFSAAMLVMSFHLHNYAIKVKRKELHGVCFERSAHGGGGKIKCEPKNMKIANSNSSDKQAARKLVFPLDRRKYLQIAAPIEIVLRCLQCCPFQIRAVR